MCQCAVRVISVTYESDRKNSAIYTKYPLHEAIMQEAIKKYYFGARYARH